MDTVVCLTLDKWETVSGHFGGYLTQWEQDIAHPLQATAHFDSCQIDASLQYLRTEYETADAAASRGDVFIALRHLAGC